MRIQHLWKRRSQSKRLTAEDRKLLQKLNSLNRSTELVSEFLNRQLSPFVTPPEDTRKTAPVPNAQQGVWSRLTPHVKAIYRILVAVPVKKLLVRLSAPLLRWHLRRKLRSLMKRRLRP